MHISVMVVVPKECGEEEVVASARKALYKYNEHRVVEPRVFIKREEAGEAKRREIRMNWDTIEKSQTPMEGCMRRIEKLEGMSDDEFWEFKLKELHPDEFPRNEKELMTTQNPEGILDWSVIGGRFSGWLTLEDGSRADYSRLRDLGQPVRTAAVISRDGELFWRAFRDEYDDPQWSLKFHERFIAPLDPEDWIVICDAHV